MNSGLGPMIISIVAFIVVLFLFITKILVKFGVIG